MLRSISSMWKAIPAIINRHWWWFFGAAHLTSAICIFALYLTLDLPPKDILDMMSWDSSPEAVEPYVIKVHIAWWGLFCTLVFFAFVPLIALLYFRKNNPLPKKKSAFSSWRLFFGSVPALTVSGIFALYLLMYNLTPNYILTDIEWEHLPKATIASKIWAYTKWGACLTLTLTVFSPLLFFLIFKRKRASIIPITKCFKPTLKFMQTHCWLSLGVAQLISMTSNFLLNTALLYSLSFSLLEEMRDHYSSLTVDMYEHFISLAEWGLIFILLIFIFLPLPMVIYWGRIETEPEKVHR